MSMVRCAGALIIVAELQGGRVSAIAARGACHADVMVPAMYNLCLLQADFDSHDCRRGDRRLRRRADAGGAIEKLAQKIPGLK